MLNPVRHFFDLNTNLATKNTATNCHPYLSTAYPSVFKGNLINGTIIA